MIEDSAFSNVPSNVFEPEDYETYPTSLTTLTFGDNDKEIKLGHNAFAHDKVKNITLPNTLTTIGYHAFYSTDFETITIPRSVTSIGVEAFFASEIKTIYVERTQEDFNANVTLGDNWNDGATVIYAD